MTTLVRLARQNRERALIALARKKDGNILRVAFGQSRSAPLPVLQFVARRQACPELAPLPVAAQLARPPLVLVSDTALPQVA